MPQISRLHAMIMRFRKGWSKGDFGIN
ncbi:hypothetical protein RHCRD62_90149 [Rhodococcus sp. RD6.2]|nr:hypothetical protein RHCRD62_90149 [Rhodococcus sp. RD6.2]